MGREGEREKKKQEEEEEERKRRKRKGGREECVAAGMSSLLSEHFNVSVAFFLSLGILCVTLSVYTEQV
jgi:hypothetical protein